MNPWLSMDQYSWWILCHPRLMRRICRIFGLTEKNTRKAACEIAAACDWMIDDEKGTTDFCLGTCFIFQFSLFFCLGSRSRWIWDSITKPPGFASRSWTCNSCLGCACCFVQTWGIPKNSLKLIKLQFWYISNGEIWRDMERMMKHYETLRFCWSPFSDFGMIGHFADSFSFFVPCPAMASIQPWPGDWGDGHYKTSAASSDKDTMFKTEAAEFGPFVGDRLTMFETCSIAAVPFHSARTTFFPGCWGDGKCSALMDCTWLILWVLRSHQETCDNVAFSTCQQGWWHEHVMMSDLFKYV